jgi:hypothetical protein
MKKTYLLLASLLLTGGVARAQTSASLLRPAQTIELGPHATVGGTIALPNHNLVLLLTDSESLDIVAQCLAPDGHTLWKTALTRFGRSEYSAYMLDTRDIAIGATARENKQLKKEKIFASLFPVNVLTDGNDVVLSEYVFASDVKRQPKNNPNNLQEGQRFVQRLDEQGRLTKHLFEPSPAPESKKIEVNTLARYAEASGYAEVVREINAREETTTFYTVHYDLGTKATRREPLVLPATQEIKGGIINFYRHWYQGWAYLGHRPGQTYFCRRTVVSTPKDKPGTLPVTYQVVIINDQGGAPSGFSTTINLNPGTQPAYSGDTPTPGEMNHIPVYYDMAKGKSYVRYDEWDTSSGGFGSFYLDHRTGDVLVYGEYGKGDLPEDGRLDLFGFFMRRYSATGQPLAQSQVPYTDAMRAFKRRASFTGYPERQTRFHADPLTGGYQFTTSTLPTYSLNDSYDLYLDHELQLLRYDHPTDKPKADPMLTHIVYAQPFELATHFDTMRDIRIFEHAAPTDLPIYAALEKQRRTATQEMPDYQFHLSPTGPSTGLVVEQPLGIGGSLRVYTF